MFTLAYTEKESVQLKYQILNSYDVLVKQIYDGDSDQAKSLGRFCGSSIPVVPPSSGSAIMLRLTTDNSGNKKGFFARYQEQGKHVRSTDTYYHLYIQIYI